MATVTPEQMKKALSSLSALEGMASGYCELQDGFDTSKGIAENVRQVLAALAATPAEARTFPIQSERAAKPHPTRIPWWLADLAYSVYRARFGSGQSLERLAERGGFHPSEMDEYVPDWRELAAQAPPASDPPGLSAEATLKSLEIGFCSSNCGPVYRADEDGCCVTCGGDITFHDRSRPLGQTRCTVCRDTALPCQLGHTGRMLGPQPVAQAPHASDPPGPTVINEDDGDVTIDFDYANDRVVSIRLGEESSGLSAFVDGESHALCPLDRVPPKVLALLRTEAKAVTLRQSDPPGLVANWRPIETAPKRTDVLAGWADRPHWLPQVLQQDDAGMWFNGEESDYRPPTHWMPLPASPQAKED